MFLWGFFTYGELSEDTLDQIYLSITFYGKGWTEKLTGVNHQYQKPLNKAIVGHVKTSECAHRATCVALTLAAIVVITETDHLPDK